MGERGGLLLVDYSACWRRHWHVSADKDVTHATRATIGQIHALASDYDHAAICVDPDGTTWRHKLSDAYKANREPLDNLAREQLRAGIETLRGDGFAVLEAPGFEADDVIATVCGFDFGPEAPSRIVIATADKDMMQLLRPGVQLWNIAKREMWSTDKVLTKFGVAVGQLGDYLVLVGDTSDNVPGVHGVGGKRAAELLQAHGTLGGVIAARDKATPAIAKALGEAHASGQLELSRALVTLRADAPVDCATVLAERVKRKASAPNEEEDYDMNDDETTEAPNENISTRGAASPPPPPPEPDKPNGDGAQDVSVEIVDADDAPRTRSLVPTSWERSLEPVGIGAAWKMAKMVVQSRMFNGFGRPEQAMLVIMAGREYGLGLFASLKGFHVIQNKPVMSAQLMMGLCLKHPSCKLFRVLRKKCTNEKAVVLVQRKEWTEPEEWEWTLADAKAAGLSSKDNWKNYTRQMLTNRCIAEAARFTWPELVGNVYVAEDFGETEAA